MIWVQATPISCLDQLECSVVDDSGDIGVNSTSIVNATGTTDVNSLSTLSYASNV